MLLTNRSLYAQLTPPGGGATTVLDSWPFTDTNWLSNLGFPPLSFTNIVNLEDGGDGNALWLDYSNLRPAYIFYNVVETNGATNISFSNGSLSFWFSPDWSGTNEGGTGPGDWANLISAGQWGTNGTPWWSLYLNPDGTTVFFAATTNGGSSSVYLSAPVTLDAYGWYNLALTYGPTNTALYLNGSLLTNGLGVTNWPGTDVTFFAIGSDTNGFFQAQGVFDDLIIFNYQLTSGTVDGYFGMYSIFYGIFPVGPSVFIPPPSTPSVTSNFDAVTGLGYLQNDGSSSGTCATSNKVWMTNMSATIATSGTNTIVNYTFTIAGGSNSYNYDVFFTPALVYPITNATWYWVGQGPHCTVYTIAITNSPNPAGYFILGTPQDSDQDGLTDAYERLVSHTDPNNPDTDYDGRGDGWEHLDGTDPLSASSVSNLLLASWSFSDTNAWLGDQGQTPLTFTNLVGVTSWSGNAAKIAAGTNSILAYPESQLYGNANINCRNGSVSFWFKPLWNSGAGPGSTGRFLELGGEGSNGWWAIVVNTNGTSLSLVTQTNSVKTTNVTAPIDWIYTGWHQVVVTYSPTNSAIYLDGAGVVTNGSGTTSYPSASLRALGLRIGSDIIGGQQANGYFKKVATYTYPLASTVIASNYAADAASLPVDLDFDGLDAAAELAAGTSATSPDSDGDGLSDWYELNVSHTNPTSAQAVPSLSDRPIVRCPSN